MWGGCDSNGKNFGGVFRNQRPGVLQFAFGSESFFPRLGAHYCEHTFGPSAPCWMLSIFVRAVLLLAMLTSNSYGLMMTVNGMKESGSYLGVVLVTATNFIASATLGLLIFGETLSVKWWFGASCILLGVFLITVERPQARERSSDDSSLTKVRGVSPKADKAPTSNRKRRVR